MLNQGKVSRGVSYSPKISVGAKTLPEKPSPEASSKWSRVRNAFLNRSDSLYLEENSLASMSVPNSPVVRNSATFFAEDEEEEESTLQILSKDEKDLAGSRS